MENPKYIDANGVRTRYFEAGEGEPLVLVHQAHIGSPANAEEWDLNFDSLAESFHVYAYDKVGMGFTDNPLSDEEYMIGSAVQHLQDFMEALGIESAHIAGHSRGGYAVARLALEHPEMVKSLIIIDSSTLVTPPNPIYDEWAKQAALIEDPRERQRYLMEANSFSGDHITEHQIDLALEILSLAKTQKARAIMGEQREEFRDDLVARQKEIHEWIRAGGITAPTLILWAFNDPSATMERCGIPAMELIMSSVPNSQMHIFNQAGHHCFREQPEAFNTVVTDFIKANSGGK